MPNKPFRLNPMPPDWYLFSLGNAYCLTGQYEEGSVTVQKVLKRNPDDLMTHIALTTSYSMGGREKEARAHAAEVLRINPKFSLEYFARTLPYKNKARIEQYIEALRKAGLK